MEEKNELVSFDTFTKEDQEEIIKLMIEAYTKNEGVD